MLRLFSFGGEIATKFGSDMDGQEDCEGKAVIKNDKNGMNVPRGRPGKKRKIAMLLAYCGAGYQGMQRNPGAITIEGELEHPLRWMKGSLHQNLSFQTKELNEYLICRNVY
jgi:hypothetical protein